MRAIRTESEQVCPVPSLLYLPHYRIESALEVGVPHLVGRDDNRALPVAYVRLHLHPVADRTRPRSPARRSTPSPKM